MPGLPSPGMSLMRLNEEPASENAQPSITLARSSASLMSLISGRSSTTDARSASVIGRRWMGGVPRMSTPQKSRPGSYRFAKAGQFGQEVVLPCAQRRAAALLRRGGLFGRRHLPLDPYEQRPGEGRNGAGRQDRRNRPLEERQDAAVRLDQRRHEGLLDHR